MRVLPFRSQREKGFATSDTRRGGSQASCFACGSARETSV